MPAHVLELESYVLLSVLKYVYNLGYIQNLHFQVTNSLTRTQFLRHKLPN